MSEDVIEARGRQTYADSPVLAYCHYCDAGENDCAAECPKPTKHADRVRQRMLQAKLDAMFTGGALKLDTSRLTCKRCGVKGGHRDDCARAVRNASADADAVTAPDRRFALAQSILLAMIGNGGIKHDKVRAAVEYADLLIEELEKS